MSDIPRMHDWTLRSVNVDWQSGTAEFCVLAPDGAKILTAHGLKDLRLPKKSPWGPSISINSAEGPAQREGGLHLRFEMQSGDQIEVIATSFDVKDA